MTEETKPQFPDESSGQIIDGETGLPDPTPPKLTGKDGKPRRRIDLSSLRDVRLEMAHVYREMEAGLIETQDGTRRVYVLAEIGKVITVAEIERRLTELEGRQDHKPRPFGQPARLN